MAKSKKPPRVEMGPGRGIELPPELAHLADQPEVQQMLAHMIDQIESGQIDLDSIDLSEFDDDEFDEDLPVGEIIVPDTPWGKAYELCQEAMETDSPKRRRELIAQATKICPDCAVIYVLQSAESEDDQQSVELMIKAVGLAQASCEQYYQRNPGGGADGIPAETIVLLDSAWALGRRCWEARRLPEAIKAYQFYLQLNPKDRDYARGELLTCLLVENRNDEAQDLIDEYDDDWAETRYSAALIAFRREGDTPEARKLLKRAQRTNRRIPDFLDGSRELPLQVPDTFAARSEDEALCYVSRHLRNWRETEGAVPWLRQVLKRGLPGAKRAKTKGKAKAKRDRATATADDAAGEMNLDRIPQAVDVVWQVDLRDISTPAREYGDEPFSVLVVANSAEGELVDHFLLDAPRSTGEVWESLGVAMRKPPGAEPLRPGKIQFRQAALWKALRPKLEKIDVAAEFCDEMPFIDDIIGDLRDYIVKTMSLAVAKAADIADDSIVIDDLPHAADESWQVDWRQMPIVLPGDDGMQRPWIVVICGGDERMVLGHHILTAEPTIGDVDKYARLTMVTPGVGDPRRPSRVEVRSPELAASLRRHLTPADVQVTVRDDLPMVDFLLAELAGHLSGEQPVPAMIDAPGVTAEMLGGVFDAAAAFRRRKPWKLIGGDRIVHVSSPGLPIPDWYGTVMGQSGMTYGLALYDDLTLIRQVMSGMYGGGEDSFSRTSAISLTYGEAFDILPRDLAAQEQYGWPVDGPEGYPTALRVEPGKKMRPLIPWELSLLEAALRALPEFLAKKTPSDKVVVATTQGDLTLELKILTV